MTDLEKRNIVESIVKKSKILFDLSGSSNDCYEKIMGSDYFFVLSNKQNSDKERKELHVIVDEKYAFVQATTFELKDDEETSRYDEIVLFKKSNADEICIESASLRQLKKDGKKFTDLHSIGEMAKIDSSFDDSMIKREFINVAKDFKFTLGFENEKKNTEHNLIGKYIQFNLKLKDAM